jgi:dTDP-glucose 4,6-dehydratase
MRLSLKKIIITGAGGFIGSHLVEACVERGLKVRAFVRNNNRKSGD